MADKNTSPYYDGSGLLKMDSKGNVIMDENDIVSEMLARINSHRGSYLFNSQYGSSMIKVMNSSKVTNSQVYTYINEALSPMIDSGKLKNNINVNIFKTGRYMAVTVTAQNSQNEQVTAIFRSMLN